MAVGLTTEELGLMIKKYVEERTPVTGFSLHDAVKAKLAGRVDSLTTSGLVIRTEDSFLEIDVAGAFQFEMGDARDCSEGIEELAAQYPSSLCFRLPSGAVVAVFEQAQKLSS